MTTFEQMVTDELKYLRKRMDELHSVVQGNKVKLGIIGTVAGMVGAGILTMILK